MNRREFLKFISAFSTTLGLSIPAFAHTRKPYVEVGEIVDYIGHHPGGFTGGRVVKKIFDWDGVGYPVVFNDDWDKRSSPTYYDFDLSNFNEDVPKDFWHHMENVKRYNNFHTYVRTQRFGETIEEAMKHLNFVSWKR